MNHRERMLTALRHEEPDRVPIDFGGTVDSSILAVGYQDLRKQLKLCPNRTHVSDIYQQTAVIEDDIRQALGVDALNPVQVSAQGMDTKLLKREFGRDITFWGAGCESQTILPFGSREEVTTEVKRRIDDLADGGGFVFSPIHNIQAHVPSENIIAMFETAREYDVY